MLKNFIVIFLLLMPAVAFTREAPQFPFHDWTKITEGALSWTGGLGFCGQDEGHQVFANYFVERADGNWIMTGAANQDESKRWYATYMDEKTFKPAWIYFGTTSVNEILLERVEVYDPEKYKDGACPILFPPR